MNRDNILRIKKLIYRSSHRGCKETDYIFTDFALNELHKLSDEMLNDYEKLIEVDDALLYNWFTGESSPAAEFNNVLFRKIKEYNEQNKKRIYNCG
jgi:antitoxin CptB